MKAWLVCVSLGAWSAASAWPVQAEAPGTPGEKLLLGFEEEEIQRFDGKTWSPS